MLNTFVQILEGPVSAAKLKILRAADKSLTIDLTPLTPAQRDQVRQYMPDGIFGKTFCDSWIKNILSATDNWEPFIALLLLLLPELETILMEDYWDHPRRSFIDRVHEQARVNQDGEGHPLSYLQHISLHSSALKYG